MVTVPLSGLIGHLRCVSVAADRGMSDRELLEQFRAARDEAAFEILVRRHGPMVLSVCRRILPGGHDAEDAFQMTFLVLVRKAHAIGQPELLGNWLHGVACRTAHKARTMLARRQSRELPLGDWDVAGADRSGTRELRLLLDDELSRLPAKYRVPLILCELEGHSRRQAAETLGLPEGTLSSRLARGRLLLANLLSRRGVVLSVGALTAALASARSDAALSPLLVRQTVHAAIAAASSASALGVGAILGGVINGMTNTKMRVVLGIAAGLALVAAGMFALPGTAEPPAPVQEARGKPDEPGKAAARGYSVIILWMGGGPSQMDTFDLKPGQANGGPFKEIATSVKGICISEHLPKLAKHLEHMVLIRTLTHREGDHARGSYLMHTGYAPMQGVDYPVLGSVLAKELGTDKANVPDFVSFTPPPFGAPLSSGYLGSRYGPVTIMRGDQGLEVPDVEVIRVVAKDRAPAWHKALTEALDLSTEKDAVRDAYGRNAFGDNCLAARRLVERRVPVIEIALGGWDTHQANFAAVEKLSGTLDAGWATLMAELKDRKLLGTTLIVWMGEFGRTPRINGNMGRDHWPGSFTAVLAGGPVKGGQVIGKTNADGVGVAEGAVSVPEFMATIYRAVGVDSNKRYNAGKNAMIPIVDGKADPIQEVLPKAATPSKKQYLKK